MRRAGGCPARRGRGPRLTGRRSEVASHSARTASAVDPRSRTSAAAKASSVPPRPRPTARRRGHRRLVIVESPGEGADDPGLPRPGLRGRGQRRSHPRPAEARRGHPGEVQGRDVGQARRRRRRRLRAALRRRRRQAQQGRRAQAQADGRRRAAASPQTRTARARPSRGTCSRCSTRRSRSSAWCSTRSPSDAIRAGGRADPRPRPEPGRRAGDPPHPRPALRLRGLARCCGRRSCRGCRPAGCSPSPPGSSSSASASGSRSAPRRTGTSRACSTPAPFDARLVAVDGARVAQGRDFDTEASCKRRADAASTSTRRRATSLAAALRGRGVRGPLARGQAVQALARRAVHDLDAAAGGRPQAAAGPRSARCASRRACTSAASSPTCAPTRRRCRRPRSPRRARRPAELYGAEYVSEVPRRYERRSRTRRRRTRRSVRRATRSARPAEVAGELAGDEFALYELIWKRTVASQMTDARGTTATLRLRAPPPSPRCLPRSGSRPRIGALAGEGFFGGTPLAATFWLVAASCSRLSPRRGTTRMKIVHVIARLNVGGAALSVLELAAGQQRARPRRARRRRARSRRARRRWSSVAERARRPVSSPARRCSASSRCGTTSTRPGSCAGSSASAGPTFCTRTPRRPARPGGRRARCGPRAAAGGRAHLPRPRAERLLRRRGASAPSGSSSGPRARDRRAVAVSDEVRDDLVRFARRAAREVRRHPATASTSTRASTPRADDASRERAAARRRRRRAS